MLFTSPEFFFVFLPATFLGFWALSRQQTLAILWLIAASISFYAYWDAWNLFLLIPSIACNYLAGQLISSQAGRARFLTATIAVAGNLAVLLYFKYTGFLVANLEAITGSSYGFAQIALPLGVSFITFQKIAYIVDVYQGKVSRTDPLRFALFVSFFPQLIAGPISHHAEILPQLQRRLAVRSADVAAGLSLFSVGLFKKVIIADSISSIADAGFAAASKGSYLTADAAWASALAYTLQLYFDFSGYCEMACGLALMFGIRLPVNFLSPYKSPNIIEFWRRWHITLSRFLRDYLYIPLGGNRVGPGRHWFNLFATMALGGLWHGAGWTFILWGAYHGLLLLVNHAFRSAFSPFARYCLFTTPIFVLCTFVAVVLGWVLFRADSVSAATIMLKSMLPLNFSGEVSAFRPEATDWMKVGVALAIVWFLPNSYQIFASARPAFGDIPPQTSAKWLSWRPTLIWIVIVGSAIAVAMLPNKKPLSFLYFQF